MDFSIIIPAYNVSRIIGRAIRSAASQTFPPLEILVIDDCSTDDTVEVGRALLLGRNWITSSPPVGGSQ